MASSTMTRTIAGLLIATSVAACSLVPNMDPGTSGCSNAVGIGARGGVGVEVGRPVMGDLVGLEPAAAANIAASRGHTVVFNVQIPAFGECWCVPPPEGEVVEAFFTERGALMLMVDGVDEGHTAADQPPTGWGCP
jgi:hypothetical protein